MAKLYRLTKNGRELASFHAAQIETDAADMLQTVAASLGGKTECVKRGKVSHYTDGAIIIRPRRKDGRVCGSPQQILFYTLTPYYFQPTN